METIRKNDGTSSCPFCGFSDGEDPKGKKKIINESGLYSLILSSKKPEAKAFKTWITSEVIPAIRKTGGFNMIKTESKPIMHNQFYMLDEYNLHTRIIKFIREYLPHFI